MYGAIQRASLTPERSGNHPTPPVLRRRYGEHGHRSGGADGRRWLLRVGYRALRGFGAGALRRTG